MKPQALKAWGDEAWRRKLTKTLSVARVDDDVPGEELKGQRKPWFLALTQKTNLLEELGGVRGLPEGHTMLLSEDDVVALVRYLFEPQIAMWVDEPEISQPGDRKALVFEEQGMLGVSDDDEIVNGEANWSKEYFEQTVAPHDQPGLLADFQRRNGKLRVHTLPWKWTR